MAMPSQSLAGVDGMSWIAKDWQQNDGLFLEQKQRAEAVYENDSLPEWPVWLFLNISCALHDTQTEADVFMTQYLYRLLQPQVEYIVATWVAKWV